MIAIGKEDRPTMGLFVLEKERVSERGGAGAVGIDAPDGNSDVGGINDHAIGSPRSATSGEGIGEDLGSSARDGDFLELVIGEEAKIGVVRRPEGKAGAFGSGEGHGVRSPDALDVEQGNAGDFTGGNESEHGAVAGEGHVFDFGGNWNGELHTDGRRWFPRDKPGDGAGGDENSGDGEPKAERLFAWRMLRDFRGGGGVGTGERAESEGEIAGGLEALLGIFFQAAADDAVERRGDRVSGGGEFGRVVF
jgi:hypothetical protein